MRNPEEMRCERVRRYLSPYLDSELDATTTCEVSRHLEICRSCARLFRDEQEVEQAMAATLREPRGDEDAVFARAFARAVRPRRWPVATGVLMVTALAAVILNVVLGGPAEILKLLTMVVEDHQQYLRGDIAPEFRPGGPESLDDFLARHLDGPVGPVPAGAGWALEGARICRFEGAPIGFLTLRYHGIPVSVADLPGDPDILPAQAVEAARDGRCFEVAGGRGVVGLTRSGLRAVFGDVEMARLEEVLHAAR